MLSAWVRRLSREFGCTDGQLAPQYRQGPRALSVAVGNALACCQVQAVQRRQRRIPGWEEPEGAGGSRSIQTPLRSQTLRLSAENFGKRFVRKGTPRELQPCQLEASNKASNKLIYCDGQRAGPHSGVWQGGDSAAAFVSHTDLTQCWPRQQLKMLCMHMYIQLYV